MGSGRPGGCKIGSRTSNLDGSRYGDWTSWACSFCKTTGTPGGRVDVPSGDGIFGGKGVSEESTNHGTRECKGGETEEKYRVEHLTAACCHMITAENEARKWRWMSTTRTRAYDAIPYGSIYSPESPK
jgi:hypothetical protein